MGRIITPDGMIPGQGGNPDRPPTMRERLDFALEHWKYKRRDEAFAATLNCIAYLSQGLSGMAKLTEQMRIENGNLKDLVLTLQARLDILEKQEPLPPPPSSA